MNISKPSKLKVALVGGLLLIAGHGGAGPIKIAIASDSTAAIFPTNDYGKRIGWGQALSNFFGSDVTVSDLAESGRSSKSFYEETPVSGWSKCLATHADFYLIQFGHNDDKPTDPTRYTDPQTTFKSYLSNYVNQARAQGGVPVLVTPPTRRTYWSTNAFLIKPDNLQNYSQAMRELAVAMNVPILDVYPKTLDFYGFVGKTNCGYYQANTDTNTFQDDTTHFSEAGARQHCYLLIESLLTSTDTLLAPLKNAVMKKGVPLQVELTATQTVQLKVSTNLMNWRNYGAPLTVPPSVLQRYLYICGQPTTFFRFTTN